MKPAWCNTKGSRGDCGKRVLRKRVATTQFLLITAPREGGRSATAGPSDFLGKARTLPCKISECPGSGPDFLGSNSGQLLNLFGHQFCHLQNGDKYACQSAQPDCRNDKPSEKPDRGDILNTSHRVGRLKNVHVIKDKRGCSISMEGHDPGWKKALLERTCLGQVGK